MDTEDGLLHCIKPGGVAADAVATISAEKAMLIAGNETTLTDHIPMQVMNSWLTTKLS